MWFSDLDHGQTQHEASLLSRTYYLIEIIICIKDLTMVTVISHMVSPASWRHVSQNLWQQVSLLLLLTKEGVTPCNDSLWQDALVTRLSEHSDKTYMSQTQPLLSWCWQSPGRGVRFPAGLFHAKKSHTLWTGVDRLFSFTWSFQIFLLMKLNVN